MMIVGVVGMATDEWDKARHEREIVNMPRDCVSRCPGLIMGMDVKRGLPAVPSLTDHLSQIVETTGYSNNKLTVISDPANLAFLR
jgi:hypothetical protein